MLGWEEWAGPFAAAWVVVFGSFRFVESIWRRLALPFRPGIYLFSTAIVDARSGVLRVYDPKEATDIDEIETGSGRSNEKVEIIFSFSDRSFSFFYRRLRMPGDFESGWSKIASG